MSFLIYDGESVSSVIIDEKYSQGGTALRDHVQILRALGDLRQDIAMVTGAIKYEDVAKTFVDSDSSRDGRLDCADKAKTPRLCFCGEGIIAGTVKSSAIIQKYIKDGGFDEAAAIQGKWEAFAIKEIGGSLVIAGSDARGTIYGIYALSEKIGVSPWYWMSDAPVEVKSRIEVNYENAFVDCGPSVKYRGIFINDEERLMDWAREKFPTENGTPDVNFYRHVFELLLRLRGNTLWPAMHEGTTAFNAAKDENGVPVNAKEAAKYGVIMASSHCEMMLRCNVGEWSEFKEKHFDEYDWKDGGSFDYTQNKAAILGYWRERLETNRGFESILSLGIRGIHDGDAECSDLSEYGGSKVNMMADVIREQRKLIAEVYGSETAAAQAFIPYKGMADIYNGGLADQIPDDVMLMWAEDNYGNLRQTPNAVERARSGGCGVYYHISYWSWYNPKSYLWLDSAQIFYMAHQLCRAYDTGADRYWILNVGDIKPGDIATELFLKIAWDINNAKNIKNGFLKSHAMRDYNMDAASAQKFSDAAAEFYLLCGIKKAEFFGHENAADVENTYFSEDMIFPFGVTDCGDEGMRFVRRCNKMADDMSELYGSLDEKYRDVFYEEIYYHVLCYRDVALEYVYLWKNNLAARRGAYNAANVYKRLSQRARESMKSRQKDYWACGDNKWTYVINYDHPVTYYNMNEGVLAVRDEKYMLPKPGRGIGAESESKKEIRFDKMADNRSYIDVFAKGEAMERWRIEAPSWVSLSKSEGSVRSEERVTLCADWSRIKSPRRGVIRVIGQNDEISIPVKANTETIELEDAAHVEANGLLVLDSTRYTENIAGDGGDAWHVWENAARFGNAMTALPFDAKRADGENIKRAARLRYRVYFSSGGTFDGYFYRVPTLNEGNDGGEKRTCRAALGIDGGEIILLCGCSAVTEPTWKENVMRMVERIGFKISVTPGWHDIYVYRSDAGIIFERIVIETEKGRLGDSLTGPEESPNSFGEEKSLRYGIADLPEEIKRENI